MIASLYLDSGPLGILTNPLVAGEVVALADWLGGHLVSGTPILVPAIVYYELRRELLRAGKTHGLARLDAFCFATPDRYLPLTDSALRLAAELWADARRRGTPTPRRWTSTSSWPRKCLLRRRTLRKRS